MLSGKAGADVERDADSEDSDDDIDLFEEKRYEKNKSKKLDDARKRTAREGDSSGPVHWAGRVLPSKFI